MQFVVCKILIRYRLVILFFFLLSGVSGQSSRIRFNRLNGLSQRTVKTVFHDKRGFIWFGTEDGLNRWDGYEIKIYRNIRGQSGSLSHSRISHILEDNDGEMWIATIGGGLNKYDRRQDAFVRYVFDDPEADNAGFLHINTMMLDKAGDFWIGFDTGGLVQWNPDSGMIAQYKHREDLLPHCVLFDDIYAIEEDINGDIWIGHSNGLDILHRKTQEFSHYHKSRVDSVTNNNFEGTHVNTIYLDSRGNMWVGTHGSGLALYNRGHDSFVHFKRDVNDPRSIGDNNIFVMEEDDDGELWIGTEYGGLNRFVRADSTFERFQYSGSDEASLPCNSVESLCDDGRGTIWVGTYAGGAAFFHKGSEKFEFFTSADGLSTTNVTRFFQDSDGVIWVGTDGGGLNRFDRQNRSFNFFTHSVANPSSISGNSVFSLYEDRQGRFWVGTYSGGLNLFDKNSGSFKHYKHDPDNPYSLAHNDVRSLIEDSYGIFWVGTSGGLHTFDRENQKFRHYPNIYEGGTGTSQNFIFSLFEDSEKELWIGTYGGGLNRYNRETDDFDFFQHDDNDSGSISNNLILAIREDEKKRLWIGTGGGLNLFDRKTQTFQAFFVKDGLPNDFICGVEIADDGALWLSTYHGICRFHPDSMTFRNYDVSDGLQSNDFVFNAHMKSSSGEIYFGGNRGFNVFHPERIKDNPRIPPVVFTNIMINNRPVDIDCENGTIDAHINEAGAVNLYPGDLILTLTYAALNYEKTHKNRYQYILEGFDADWNYVGNNRTATYTNLNPGRYLFKVRGSNNDGKWNMQGKSILIIVHPPFYMTWWFRLIIAVVILSGVYGVYLMRTIPIKKKNRDLECINIELGREMQERARAEALIRDSLSEKEIMLKEIHHRVKNNLQIISSLLSLQARRVENEAFRRQFKDSQDRIRSMALVHEKLYQSDNFSGIDFGDYIKDLVNGLFQAYRLERNRIRLETDIDKIVLSVDKAIPLGLVLNELVSNAMKHAFTDSRQSDGVIKVVFQKNEADGQLQLTVSDNGKGFPEDLNIAQSSSLGLKLINILIEEQLKGELHISNHNGAFFNITLPD